MARLGRAVDQAVRSDVCDTCASNCHFLLAQIGAKKSLNIMTLPLQSIFDFLTDDCVSVVQRELQHNQRFYVFLHSIDNEVDLPTSTCRNSNNHVLICIGFLFVLSLTSETHLSVKISKIQSTFCHCLVM